MNEPVLSFREVVKEFPAPSGPVRVLHGVTTTIHAGDFVAITGPSGSGKSTFLHLAGMLDRPSSGDILWLGQNITGLSDAALSTLRGDKLGVVFQKFCLLPRRSVIDNVLFRFRYATSPPKDPLQRARNALAWVGLSSIEKRRARLLSGGEMQRVAIARAIALQPRILLADEPTGNLDPASASEVMECFRRLNAEQGITVLLATHNPALLTYCNRHVRFEAGRLRENPT